MKSARVKYSPGRWVLLPVIMLPVVISVFLYCDDLLCANAGKQPDYSKTPVLLVHGHGLYARDWEPLINKLIEQGYPPEYLLAVQIEPNTMANIDAANRVLMPAAKQLLDKLTVAGAGAEQSRRKINIVAHSMGAVSSRWLAVRLIPESVNVWIGITPSNHGTDTLCRYRDVAAREMCPAFAQQRSDSEIQIELNGVAGDGVDETPYGIGLDGNGVRTIPADRERRITFFTIRIEPDEWIKPERSALLDGAGGPNVAAHAYIKETSSGNYLYSGDPAGKPVDHENILTDKNLLEFVSDLLEAGYSAAE